jgi:zinc transport system permease protein
MTANLFTVNYARMILLSILFSFLGNVAGLILSYYLNVPSGALIIFVLILIFFAAKIIKTFAKKNRPAMA